MATTCTNCGCSKLKCGCQDTMLTTPAPCPTPVGCPTPEPCSEVFDAQCIVYTGDDVLCNNVVIVPENTNVADALNNIVDLICEQTTIPDDIICDQDTVVDAGTTVVDAILDVVDYFCNNTGGGTTSIVEAGDNTTVTSVTVGSTTTYTVNAACPISVDIERVSQDPAYFGAVVTGGVAPYTYEWSFADTYNNTSTSMYELVPHPTDADKTWYAFNPLINDIFDACSSSNTGRVGLLKVKVTDANGCSAKDTHLIIRIICA